MVCFICDACGQTVKKQKVEKHYQTECRNCSVLSCIDCGKDFPGDSYASHTSCISEAEKYQGKLYKAKDKSNKGERKQQEWIEQVRNASDETGKQDPRIRKLLARITACDNVPRKERKFKKFCENSINVRDTDLLEKLWEVFSGVKNSNPENNESESKHDETKDVGGIDEERPNVKCCNDNNLLSNVETTAENNDGRDLCSDSDEGEKEKLESKGKKKKKRKFEAVVEEQENGINEKTDVGDCGGKKKKKQKKDEKHASTGLKVQEESDNENVSGGSKEKFKWENIIKKVLKSAPDHEMPVKKLRKKVINEYVAHGGDAKPRTEQELRVLFEKKLHKNCKVHKERAKLIRK